MKLIVTGASGLLGSAVYNAFLGTHTVRVLGLAHSRASGALRALDLTDSAAVEQTFSEFFTQPEGVHERRCECLMCLMMFCIYITPAGVVHCAAERRPDVAQQVSILT